MGKKKKKDRFEDGFQGDTRHLLDCVEALLGFDAAGQIKPHGLGGHGRTLLSACAARLAKLEGKRP